MSRELLEYVRQFLADALPAGPFAEKYIARWKVERDDGRVVLDPPDLSAVLSTAFCLCDLYNGDADRLKYEIDERQLRKLLGKLLDEYAG